jgi:hypothetical protein
VLGTETRLELAFLLFYNAPWRKVLVEAAGVADPGAVFCSRDIRSHGAAGFKWYGQTEIDIEPIHSILFTYVFRFPSWLF